MGLVSVSTQSFDAIRADCRWLSCTVDVENNVIVTITRVARQPFTFSSPVYPSSPVDGLTLPKGTILSSAAQAIHMDPEVYPDPEVFDPWRFSRMRENAMGYNRSIKNGKQDEQGKESGGDPEEDVRWQLVNTTLEYLPFGYGKHSW